MALNPDIQARGQAEVDYVLKTQRLPTHADRDSLQYVSAIVKEVLRWNPAVPLGKPRHVFCSICLLASFQDFLINSLETIAIEGSVYPREPSSGLTYGKISSSNYHLGFYSARSILHDETIFPEPDAFRPERFLGDNMMDRATDPSILAFGFGRR